MAYYIHTPFGEAIELLIARASIGKATAVWFFVAHNYYESATTFPRPRSFLEVEFGQLILMKIIKNVPTRYQI